MRLRALKWLMMGLASIGSIVFALATTSTEAVACFGRCCGGGCGYRPTYYRPAYFGYRGSCGAGCSGCVLGCAPCGSGCAPCGGVACSSGNCGVAPPAEPIAPIPQPNSKWNPSTRTYADPDATTAPEASGAAAARTQTDESIERSAQKPEDGIKQSVQKRQKSTDESSGTDEASSGDHSEVKRKKKGPEIASPEEDANAQRSAPVPVVSIDEKIAWRPAPIRRRGEIHGSVASARLIRLPAYPKSEWLPGEGTSIAKK